MEKRQTGAEIEITPEMIEAGVAAYCAFDERCGLVEEMVFEIVVSALGASEKTIAQHG